MFRIGDFSKFSRVSVRMLRHYDELDLLKPAHVDPSTDYRFYNANQLPRLHRILALQDLGFSLDQIKPLLNREVTAEEMRGMLLLKQAEMQNKVERDLERLARIEGHINQVQQSEAPHYDVVLRKTQGFQVATIRVDEDQDLTPLFEELEAYIGRFGARQADPPLTLYFGDEGIAGSAVAVPIKRQLPADKRVKNLELPTVENMACVVHAGNYASIQQARNSLMTWIEAGAYRPAGPLREVYYRFGAGQVGYQLPPAYLSVDESEFVTELQVPVERS